MNTLAVTLPIILKQCYLLFKFFNNWNHLTVVTILMPVANKLILIHWHFVVFFYIVQQCHCWPTCHIHLKEKKCYYLSGIEKISFPEII